MPAAYQGHVVTTSGGKRQAIPCKTIILVNLWLLSTVVSFTGPFGTLLLQSCRQKKNRFGGWGWGRLGARVEGKSLGLHTNDKTQSYNFKR